jgi:hypothetical protein
MFRWLLLCGCLAFATSGLGAQEEHKDSVKQDFKTAGKDVGHGAKKVGHGFKRGGKDVGHGFKRGAKDVGHGFKHAADKD